MSPRSRLSEKPIVVEQIFRELWDPGAQNLRKTLVMADEVGDAIRRLVAERRVSLSDPNTANFLKDYLRSPTRNEQWPELLKQQRFSAVERKTRGRSFEFIAFSPGQTEPFPTEFPLDENAPHHLVQTLTLPLLQRHIARWDEPRLIQAAVALRIIETHFGLVSTEMNVRQVAHVQNNVKLSKGEIDALFIAEYNDEHDIKRAAITREVKHRDPLVASQIEQQVRAVADLPLGDFDLVIPIAMKAIPQGIHLIEFQSVAREDAADFTAPVPLRQARYVPEPPLPGLNAPAPPTPRRRQRTSR